MYATLFWNTITLIGVSLLIFICVLFIGYAARIVTFKIANIEIPQNGFALGYLAALPFGLAAIVLGILSGSSNEPSAAAMVTGLISLISGAGFVVFHKDLKVLVPVGIVIFVFAINLFAGTSLGQGAREMEKKKAIQDALLSEEEMVSKYLEKTKIEFRVNNYRGNLGLSPVNLIDNERKDKNPNK